MADAELKSSIAELKSSTFFRSTDEERGTPAHWETDMWCIDGRVVIGLGDTKEASIQLALERAVEHHAFLAADPRERLKRVLARAPGASYLLADDVTHAIKALAEIVLDEKAK